MKLALILSAFVLLALIGITGCNMFGETYTLPDVTKETMVTLHKKDSQKKAISGMRVDISGHVDGLADITLMLDGQPYDTKHVTGDIKINFSGEWYADTINIQYKPVSVQTGNISMNYEFFEMD